MGALDPTDRDVLARVHRDVEAALGSARTLWGNDAGEETLLHTAEAYLVHLRELRRNSGTPSAEPAPAVAVGTTAVGTNVPTNGRSAAYAPSEKQIAFYQRLAQSSVFSEEERRRTLEWLATKATRQTIKDQIDWLKRQVEARTAAEVR